MDMETAIADTGFVIALLNRSDPQHSAVAAIYTRLKTAILPQTVLAEVAYLLGRDAGISTVIAFLQGLPVSRFQLTALNEQDIHRVAKILRSTMTAGLILSMPALWQFRNGITVR
jgi:predicted nucleic acid-binding protein